MSDTELLAGLGRCAELGALPQVHAENGDAVAAGQAAVHAAGVTGPEGHALSRPPALEGEATGRAIRLARRGFLPSAAARVVGGGGARRHPSYRSANA